MDWVPVGDSGPGAQAPRAFVRPARVRPGSRWTAWAVWVMWVLLSPLPVPPIHGPWFRGQSGGGAGALAAERAAGVAGEEASGRALQALLGSGGGAVSPRRRLPLPRVPAPLCLSRKVLSCPCVSGQRVGRASSQGHCVCA